MKKNKFYTTHEKAQTHDTIFPLLKAMHVEFKELSKKKPDAAVSISKIKIVNRLLEKVKILLSDEKSNDFLDILNEDDMPQMSDVTLMLSQYVAAMEAFYNKYYGFDGENFKWFIK